MSLKSVLSARYPLDCQVLFEVIIENCLALDKENHLNASSSSKVTQSILEKLLALGFKFLLINAKDNSSITDVSQIKSLQTLDASGNCGINQAGINGLNLNTLYASRNSKITDVSFMTNLQYLYAAYECGINRKGIKELALVLIDTKGNKNFE